jgi:hypothetical protein
MKTEEEIRKRISFLKKRIADKFTTDRYITLREEMDCHLKIETLEWVLESEATND